MHTKDRRTFIKNASIAIGAAAVAPGLYSCSPKSQDSTGENTSENPAGPWHFEISLAEWSFNRALRADTLTNLRFPVKAAEMGIMAVEYVNTFFKEESWNQDYLAELKKITEAEGVKNLLIMIDGEGDLGDLDEAIRIKAVENHYPWVDAAKFLGCHSIRVNARGNGSPEEVSSAAVEGLGKLTEYGAANGINIIVENHGGYSSDGSWLTGVISQVNSPYCGTLPDFGNFMIDPGTYYDHYKGVEEMMAFAKGVSAKGHGFGNGPDSNVLTDAGNVEGGEIDYERMLKIVKDAGYSGHIGIEYEGPGMPEENGIMQIKNILERVRAKLA